MIICTSVYEAAYQATDLVRSHRRVLESARHGGAFIRDKDGVVLLLEPADASARTSRIADLALDLVRAGRALLSEPGASGPDALGKLAWLSLLPTDSQRLFFREMADALFLAASGLDMRPVESMLGDWRATAEAWAQPEVRERLLADEPVESATALTLTRARSG